MEITQKIVRSSTASLPSNFGDSPGKNILPSPINRSTISPHFRPGKPTGRPLLTKLTAANDQTFMQIQYLNPMGRINMFVTLLFLLFLTTTINTHANAVHGVSTPTVPTVTSSNGISSSPLDQSAAVPVPLMGNTAPVPVPPVMSVIKRDGRREAVSFDKITKRIANLCKEFCLNELFVDPVVVAQDVVRGLFSGVTTSELDNLAAETAAYMSTIHPDYAKLASKIAISNLQKDTASSFTEAMEMLYRYVDPKSNLPASFLSDKLYERIQRLAPRINEKIVHARDFDFDYFGFKTMEKSYLLKIGTKVVERPQYMFMRVSLGIHLEEVDDDAFLQAAFETYDLMSEKWFIHASPTLFHAGVMLSLSHLLLSHL